jgi:oligoribonuclease NrnB/cAMP/cGMP phosphodiesterase (DHH superfamily)
MTIADMLDRWTIAVIKKHVGKLETTDEMAAYKNEFDSLNFNDFQKELLNQWMVRLIIHNTQVWVFESEIRNAKEGDYNVAEIARRALMTREGNRLRCVVKQEISDYFNQTVDVKTDTLAAPIESPK